MLDSTRLNEGLRNDIRHKLIMHRFKPELTELISIFKVLAQDAYFLTFSPDQRKRMEELPEGWLEAKTHIEIQLGEQRHTLRFNGELYFAHGSKLRSYGYPLWEHKNEATARVPHAYSPLRLKFTDEFVKRVHKAEQRKEAVAMTFAETLKKVDVMLRSYTTIGTLKAAWPEVAPFVPKTQPKPVIDRSLPVVSIPSLNTALGLPV